MSNTALKAVISKLEAKRDQIDTTINCLKNEMGNGVGSGNGLVKTYNTGNNNVASAIIQYLTQNGESSYPEIIKATGRAMGSIYSAISNNNKTFVTRAATIGSNKRAVDLSPAYKKKTGIKTKGKVVDV